MKFNPNYWTTVLGSFPHTDGVVLSKQMVRDLDVPAWPQLTRRTFRESMYVQYSASLPAIILDTKNEKVYFDTRNDITPELESFYERFLADDLDAFGLSPDYAAGFYAMLGVIGDKGEGNQGAMDGWIKGQVTGPISFGLTVTDQDLRASLYNELLVDAIVKNAAQNARWQIRQLKAICPNVILFVDEPYMAYFGSAYISLSREQVVAMLDEVFASIHAEGALAGVHCCGNTDWSVLMETQVDILNMDAYGYMKNLALYPAELQTFMDRGGAIAWGIVPNNDEIHKLSPVTLAEKLREGFELIAQKAKGRGIVISPRDFDRCSLVSPTCGLGPTTEGIADQVLPMLIETSKYLQNN
jgi:hypothetical protein